MKAFLVLFKDLFKQSCKEAVLSPGLDYLLASTSYCQERKVRQKHIYNKADIEDNGRH